MDYCLKCKRKTKNENETIVTIKNGRKMMKSTCAECKITKCKFLKNTEGKGVVKNIVDTVIQGIRLNYPPREREYLKKLQNINIKNIAICRTPVEGAYQMILNLLTNNDLDKQKKLLGYDDVYHLYMIAVLENGQNVLIEKNEVINIEPYKNQYKAPAKKDIMVISVNKSIDIPTMMNNAANKVGDEFFKYHTVSNNCQLFLNSILNHNGLNNNQLKSFIMQDAASLMKNHPLLTKISKTATDIAALFHRIRFGSNIINNDD